METFGNSDKVLQVRLVREIPAPNQLADTDPCLHLDNPCPQHTRVKVVICMMTALQTPEAFGAKTRHDQYGPYFFGCISVDKFHDLVNEGKSTSKMDSQVR